jgi:hypothetical protein
MLNELSLPDALKNVDDIDTRREMKIALDKLTVQQRIEFLHWCCARSNNRAMTTTKPPWSYVTITHTTGDSQEVILDLCMIHAHYGLPMNEILAELESRASAAQRLWLP